jgi:putative N-acetyltransferase (TIGR04045 family)
MRATQFGHTRPVDADVIVCRPTSSAAELALYRSIRHQVFVREQEIFAGSDLDEHDLPQAAISLLGFCRGVGAGGVRLYELDSAGRLWQGDRLAVLPRFRTIGLGGPLVRCAVATAGSLGGREMVAHIQLANVGFFTRLGWSPTGGTETYAGRPHQQMHISLPDRDAGAAIVAELARGT